MPLVSDEIYDGLVYDGARDRSALGLGDDVFVLDGFSKRYAMTGFRLGYVIAPQRALRPLQVMQQNLFISASRFVQHAGLAALREGAPTVEAMRDGLRAAPRLLLVDGLRALGFGVPVAPRGAFYVFADARDFGADSLRLAFAAARARAGGRDAGHRLRRGRRGLAALLLRRLRGRDRRGARAPGRACCRALR